VHQDVKPANILLTKDGAAKVTDFGMARARPPDSDPSLQVSLMGLTPAYCSPEQAAGRSVTRRTDLWSWAVSILEMFTGATTWKIGSAAGEVLERLAPVAGRPVPAGAGGARARRDLGRDRRAGGGLRRHGRRGAGVEPGDGRVRARPARLRRLGPGGGDRAGRGLPGRRRPAPPRRARRGARPAGARRPDPVDRRDARRAARRDGERGPHRARVGCRLRPLRPDARGARRPGGRRRGDAGRARRRVGVGGSDGAVLGRGDRPVPDDAARAARGDRGRAHGGRAPGAVRRRDGRGGAVGAARARAAGSADHREAAHQRGGGGPVAARGANARSPDRRPPRPWRCRPTAPWP
jgi:hypothetical protein